MNIDIDFSFRIRDSLTAEVFFGKDYDPREPFNIVVNGVQYKAWVQEHEVSMGGWARSQVKVNGILVKSPTEKELIQNEIKSLEYQIKQLKEKADKL